MNIAAELLKYKLLIVKKEYEQLFKILDNTRKSNKNSKYAMWDKTCYIPRDYISDIIKLYYDWGDLDGRSIIKAIESNVTMIMPVYTWLLHKKIYDFKQEDLKEIYNQTIFDNRMSKSFFEKIPFNGLCMHIHPEDSKYDFMAIVCKDKAKYDERRDQNIETRDLLFYIIDCDKIQKEMDDSNFIAVYDEYRVPLNSSKTVSECIDLGMLKCSKIMTDYDKLTDCITKLRLSLNLLSYIIAINMKIIPNDEKDFIKFHVIKPKAILNVNNDIGIVKGSSLNNNGENLDLNLDLRIFSESIHKILQQRLMEPQKTVSIRILRSDPGRVMPPHVRRGHWHKYWTGKNRMVPILRWVDSVDVNTHLTNCGSSNISVNNVSK